MLTYANFNPECSKREEKEMIYHNQLNLYQQLQQINVLLLSSMHLLNVQPYDYLPLRDYKFEDFMVSYFAIRLKSRKFGCNYFCREIDLNYWKSFFGNSPALLPSHLMRIETSSKLECIAEQKS